MLHAEGLLFDSDGVLVDSDSSVEEAWSAWARHWDLDPDEVVAQVHGTPSRRTVARLIAEPHREEALAMVDRLELERADGVRALPGAVELLASLVPGTWSVVTSGTGPLARARLLAAGIPLPEVLVTADDVTHGKPDPEPYRTAAGRLGRAPGSAWSSRTPRPASPQHALPASGTSSASPGGTSRSTRTFRTCAP